MRVRIKFAKTGCMKYVGHLDIMRYFQKAVRRSHLPIKYSEGFNPHQIMSFAAPLGVGITSEGEYMDIELTEEVASKEGLERLNGTMVDGMEIKKFTYLPDGAKNAMSSVTAASYSLALKEPSLCEFSYDELLEKKRQFFDEAKEIQIIKKTKKGERELDLKHLIYQFDIVETDGQITFELMVSTGSVDNIKPELVLTTFFEDMGITIPDHGFFIHRIDMFTTIEDAFVSLGDVGDEK